jgi:transposase-like protein
LYKKKYSPEEKIKIVNRALEGLQSINSVSLSYGISFTTLNGWIRNYQSIGSDAFYNKGWTQRTIEEKEAAVIDYISGNGSIREICKKHKISDTKTLRRWILKYNGHEKLKASGTGGSTIMTGGRKTTFDERVEIVQYCIANNHNYAETSEKYQVSYQQARNYTVKYESGGVEALQDNRGKRKSENEMSELDKLRAENRILKAEKERAEMEVSFLKKLEEIERRQG